MRPLSNPEWVAFQQDVNIDALNLPRWGGVVEWEGLDVLVFEGPGGLYLTDITSFRTSPDPRLQSWKSNLVRTWDSASELWYYRFPETFMAVLTERAVEVSGATEETVAAIAETVKDVLEGTGDVFESIGSPWFLLAVAGLAMIVLTQMAPLKKS